MPLTILGGVTGTFLSSFKSLSILSNRSANWHRHASKRGEIGRFQAAVWQHSSKKKATGARAKPGENMLQGTRPVLLFCTHARCSKISLKYNSIITAAQLRAKRCEHNHRSIGANGWGCLFSFMQENPVRVVNLNARLLLVFVSSPVCR